MTEAIAIGLVIALCLFGAAAIVAALVMRAQFVENREARTGELNAFKAKVAAENQSTADKAARLNAEGVAQKAIAALKVYEAKPATPEADRVTTNDPDRTVADRADDLERLLNL